MTPSGAKLLLGKQQVWVYVIGALFVADFVFYGYLPSHRRLQSLRISQARQAQIISTSTVHAEALSALEERLKDVKKTARAYESGVPAEGALGLFLGQIADIMTAHKLADQEVVPGQELETEAVNCIPVHMNCTGTLSGVFGFYNDLKGLGRLVRIEKVTLTNDREFSGTVTMATEAVIFYRPEKSQESTTMAGARSFAASNDDA